MLARAPHLLHRLVLSAGDVLRSVLHTALGWLVPTPAPVTAAPVPHPAAGTSRVHRPSPRQWLNVALATAQVVAIGMSAARGFGGERDLTDPPVVPALYTFSVWGVIYLGSLAYAAYQAQPARRHDPPLRRVGWWTASAFLGTALWAAAQTLGWGWGTVACMFWMLGSLLGAFVALTGTELSASERRWVATPLSIFLGYVTVASIANPASVLYQGGVQTLLGLGPIPWAVLMLLTGTAIAAALTRWSRGNVPYALTVVWALVGITVQNAFVQPNAPVAVTAGLGALALLGTLVFSRRSVQPDGATGQ